MKAVEVLKVTEADPVVPTDLLKIKAFRSATTAPTAGALRWAALVSTDVLILIPPVNTAVVVSTATDDALVAAKVNPEHVNLTLPAGTSALTSRISLLKGVAVIPLLSVTDSVAGFGTISQLVPEATAFTNPLGNSKDIFPADAAINFEDVTKVNVAV